MKVVNKILSCILVIVLLFSTTGVQAAIHGCLHTPQKQVHYYCLHTHEHCQDVDHSNEKEHQTEKTTNENTLSFSAEKCCNTSTYFFKLKISSPVLENRDLNCDYFHFPVIFFSIENSLPILVGSTNISQKPFPLKYPPGQQKPILFSQFLI